jgi:chromosome segregation ATPase
MTDFVSIRRNIIAEKQRLERLATSSNQKIAESIKELQSAVDFLDKTETAFNELSQNLAERKKDEINYKDQKKELLSSVESLKENIERVQISIKDEDDKIANLEKEISQLNSDLNNTQSELSSTQHKITNLKEINSQKTQEKNDVTARMENRLAETQRVLVALAAEKEKEVQLSPVLDFLLKEVRIDIPEVEILSVLAYRNQAMGLDELKQAVSKTPPVIILKVIRSLDSKGVIKYDERLDTIELTVNLV